MSGLDLVLPDGRRVAIAGALTIGRGDSNDVRLRDPTISRHHARIWDPGRGPVLEDVGSTYGTWLDGHRLDGARSQLRDGSRIRMGDQELVVELRRGADEAGRTIVVPAGASAAMPAATAGPRLRSGYALKRLPASEGPQRWVLRDLRRGKFLRLDDGDGRLLELLDGRRAVPELLAAAEDVGGDAAAGRLARLLAELQDRGLLAGAGADSAEPAAEPNGLARWLKPRKTTWRGAARVVDALYRHGGRLLFTRPVLVVLAILAPVGIGVFGALIAGRYGTPFVVADKIGPGGLVFLAGRFAIVALHELSHGLALASVGRRVGAVGLKLVLIFPYAYVDTSEAWLEPRRRRIRVSAAGPASDLALGAVFSITCLYLGAGTVRDIFFQLALAAYLGALFNLSPFIERDGYQVLSDVLGVPGLRRRAREQLARRLRGERRGSDSRALSRYALCALAWSVVAAAFAAAMSLRYAPSLEQLLPAPVVHGMLGALWIGLLAPAFAMVGPPLLDRLRRR